MDKFINIPFIFHLNTNSKSFVLSDIKAIIDIIISIFFFIRQIEYIYNI